MGEGTPSPFLMRLVLGLLALLLAAGPASAQDRFVAACVASAADEDLGEIDPAEICGCAAREVLAAGVPAARLDAFAAHVPASGALDVDAIPEPLRATAEQAVAGIMTCALATSLGPTADGAALAQLRVDTEVLANPERPDGVSGSAPRPAAPAAAPVTPTLPPGLRTGDGTSPVRTQQAGAGAAVRIVG